MLAAPASAYRGEQIHESRIKAMLQALDPSIHFDMGAALNIWHPKINRFQGIFRKGTHIGSMGRGYLPEFNLYREGRDAYNQPERLELLEVGWRTVLERLSRRGFPWLTNELMCAALGVDYKKFVGDESELNVRPEDVDPIHETIG